MKDCCPTCGGQLPTISISVDLNLNVLIADGRVIKLQPQQAEILSILCDRTLHVVRLERLITRVFGINEPGDALRVIRVQISCLRKILSDTSYEIENVWAVGYRIIERKLPEPIQGAA